MPGPVTVTKQYHGKQVSAMLFNRYVVEPYKVEGLSWGNDDDWQLYLPFRRGDPHPRQDLYPGAICHGFQLLRRVNFTTLLCGVVFSSNYPYAGGPRARSQTEEASVPCVVPVVTAVPNTNPPIYRNQERTYQRTANTRVETRFMPSDITTVNNVHASCRRWVRAVFPMNGDFWIFGGARITDDGAGLLRVAYRFNVPSAMRGGSPGSNPYGADVFMPDLDPMEEWALDASTMTVGKRTVANLYFTPTNPTTALPGLYPLV